MDTLSALLLPYKATIGQATGLLTAGQMLSAVFLLNDIRRRGATLATDSIIPYMGGLVLSTIGLRFGVAIADDTMIRTNFFGLALHIAYVLFFYWYTPDQRKQSVWARIGAGGSIVAAVLAYAAWENEELLATRLGLLMFAFIFSLVAMPFLGLREIIRKRSVEGLPLPLILSGTLGAGGWLLYAICLNSGVMVLQNAVLFAMGVVQLSLFVIYPASGAAAGKPTTSKRSKRKAQ